MSVALRIEVDTLPGLLEGVPAILDCLEAQRARATFFFATGVDRTRRFLPGSFARGGSRMRTAHDAGHECGVLSADPVRWRERIREADPAWTEAAMHEALSRFSEIMGASPRAHAAAGGMMNRHALRLTQRLGFDFASDSRGRSPFFPVWRGELVRCPQVPTTLATVEETLGSVAADLPETVRLLLQATIGVEGGDAPAAVYSMSAVDRTDARFPALQSLLEGWAAQGRAVVSLGDMLAACPDLPRCNVASDDHPPGAAQRLAQGDIFLGDVVLPEAA